MLIAPLSSCPCPIFQQDKQHKSGTNVYFWSRYLHKSNCLPCFCYKYTMLRNLQDLCLIRQVSLHNMINFTACLSALPSFHSNRHPLDAFDCWPGTDRSTDWWCTEITTFKNTISTVPSVCKSSLKTAKRPQPDWTKTGKDWTSSLVFWFLRIKDHKKTGLHGPVFVV